MGVTDKGNLARIVKHFKMKFKIFCCLPMTTPHHTLDTILGDAQKQLADDLIYA